MRLGCGGLVAAALAGALAVGGCSSSAGSGAGGSGFARFDHPTRVDNRWYPLRPGTRMALDGHVNVHGKRVRHRVVFIVSDATKVIDGVRSVVIWDRDYVQGKLTEGELAFQAQDDAGNVWLYGEYPEEFERGHVTGAPDTWIAGVAKARPGILMQAHPRPHTPSYSQGRAPAIDFADRAKVRGFVGRNCVPAGCYRHLLLTEEGDPVEPQAHQFKYYAPHVGNVRVGFAGGTEKEALALVKARRLGPADLRAIRRKVLAIDARAYRVSRVYRGTPRARPPS